jgi:hypothetical protein
LCAHLPFFHGAHNDILFVARQTDLVCAKRILFKKPQIGRRRCYTETYLKERKGAKKIRYRHYLSELAKKPQAVRQAVPELVGELGEPYGKLWEMLDERYGSKEASRVLSRILGAVADRS